MKQFFIILKFELINYLKNKVFVGVTLFIVAISAIAMLFSGLVNILDVETELPSNNAPIMLISADDEEDAKIIKEEFSKYFSDYNVCITDKDLNAIKDELSSQKADCAFVIDNITSYTYYVDNISLNNSENALKADSALKKVYQTKKLNELGVSAENTNEILTAKINHKIENFGESKTQNYLFAYTMILVLCMVILLYGQMIATGVATEKSSKAMELLITSAKPTALIFGKVIASCLAGLFQTVIIFGSLFLGYNINGTYKESNLMNTSNFTFPLDLMIYMMLFFILGFLIYAFLYGAVGSVASKLEDINTLVIPVTSLFTVGFIIVAYSITVGSVDNTLIVACSYIPFTSPMAMFARIAIGTVPIYEILISVVILIASVIGIGIFSARIYRVGVLLYGATPKLSSVIKAVFKNN